MTTLIPCGFEEERNLIFCKNSALSPRGLFQARLLYLDNYWNCKYIARMMLTFHTINCDEQMSLPETEHFQKCKPPICWNPAFFLKCEKASKEIIEKEVEHERIQLRLRKRHRDEKDQLLQSLLFLLNRCL